MRPAWLPGRVLGGPSEAPEGPYVLTFVKQLVLVARRTLSSAGPVVGATDLVAVLRQNQLGRSAQGIQGA